MRAALSGVLAAFGVGCCLIALAHILIGPKTIIGANTPNPTLDGDIRFAMVLFLGYGLACVWAALDLDRRAGTAHLLMLLFFLGGLVRLLTVAYVGWPDWFYRIMLAVEIVLPLVFSPLLRRTVGRSAVADLAAVFR
jgi:hypothetical protein